MTVNIQVAFAVVSCIHHGDLVILHNRGVWQVRPVGHSGQSWGHARSVSEPLFARGMGMYIRMDLALPVTSALVRKS